MKPGRAYERRHALRSVGQFEMRSAQRSALSLPEFSMEHPGVDECQALRRLLFVFLTVVATPVNDTKQDDKTCWTSTVGSIAECRKNRGNTRDRKRSFVSVQTLITTGNAKFQQDVSAWTRHEGDLERRNTWASGSLGSNASQQPVFLIRGWNVRRELSALPAESAD